MKKYELTEEIKYIGSTTLHRIRALRDFGDVKAGEFGGWVETEKNISHECNAWVYGDAKVYEDAEVYDNARVHGDAEVFSNAQVHGDAEVYDNAQVCGDAEVYDNARVCGDAQVCGDAWVAGDALVCGDVLVYGDARVCGDAEVCSKNNWIAINNIGSRNSTTTFYRNKDKGISVSCECFSGTIEEFAEAVKITHEDNQHAKEYMAAIELAKARIL